MSYTLLIKKNKPHWSFIQRFFLLYNPTVHLYNIYCIIENSNNTATTQKDHETKYTCTETPNTRLHGIRQFEPVLQQSTAVEDKV